MLPLAAIPGASYTLMMPGGAADMLRKGIAQARGGQAPLVAAAPARRGWCPPESARNLVGSCSSGVLHVTRRTIFHLHAHQPWQEPGCVPEKTQLTLLAARSASAALAGREYEICCQRQSEEAHFTIWKVVLESSPVEISSCDTTAAPV